MPLAVQRFDGVLRASYRVPRFACLSTVKSKRPLPVRLPSQRKPPGNPRKQPSWSTPVYGAKTLTPVVTVTGIQVGRLLGGTVIIEQIFALPGIGRYIFDAISTRDYPVIQGSVLFFTCVFILVNLTVDVLYGMIDPRIKFAGE